MSGIVTASATLGTHFITSHQLDAELLLILTDVPCAYRDFGGAKQEPIDRIFGDDASRLIAAGHFAPGSMQPKMEAAVRFADHPGRCDRRRRQVQNDDCLELSTSEGGWLWHWRSHATGLLEQMP
ncbi:MAG: hypothetical protein H7Z17_18450 [Fuerstia sp.]|nr:hypothetical protein [Fuerstiella sp.]